MSKVCIILLVQMVFLLINESSCLTMLGLTRGGRNSKEQPIYFPEEDNLPPPNKNERDMTYVRDIGSIAGREIIPRRWNENGPARRPILDGDGPIRQSPVISRVLSRHGGLY